MRQRGLRIHGEAIPIETSATYLGLLFHESWELDKMARERERMGLNKVHRTSSVLVVHVGSTTGPRDGAEDRHSSHDAVRV